MSVLLLPVIVSALLQIGAVQNFVAQKAARYLSSKTVTEITIGKLRITRLFNIEIKDLRVLDHKDSTLFDIASLNLDIGRIRIKERTLKVNHLFARDVDVMLRKYESDSTLNLNYLLLLFKSSDTLRESRPWTVSCGILRIEEGRFLYQDQNKDLTVSSHINFNDLLLDSINLSLSNVLIHENTVYASIDHIRFMEQSGWQLNHFQTNLKLNAGEISAFNTRIKTPRSDLDLDLSFTFDGFRAFSDFIHGVMIQSSIRPSILAARDLTYFVPAMEDWPYRIDLSGEFRGLVSNMRIRDLVLHYGSMTSLSGDVTMTGLPEIKETFVHLKLKNCLTSIEDVQYLLSSGLSTMTKIPENFNPLGIIQINGRFTGFVNDFVADANFLTNLGRVSTDLALRPVSGGKDIEYEGRIDAFSFDVGSLSRLEGTFGEIDLHADISGTGTSRETARFFIHGSIDSADLRNHRLRTIFLNGEYGDEKFNGSVIVDDPLVYLDFNGLVDFRPRMPQFDFTATIRNAHLYKLGLIEFDSIGILSTHMNLLLGGASLDSSFGRLTLDSTTFLTDGYRFYMDKFFMEAAQEGPDSRRITLRSDFADGDMNGNFYIDEFYPMVACIIDPHVSAFTADTLLGYPAPKPQHFTFNLTVNNADPFTDIFIPELRIDPEMMVKGTVNSAPGEIGLIIHTTGFSYKQMEFRDFIAEAATSGDKLSLAIDTRNLLFKEAEPGDTTDFGIENFCLFTLASYDNLSLDLSWDDIQETDFNKGIIEADLSLEHLPRLEGNISHGKMLINGSHWDINPGNSFAFDSSFLQIRNLEVNGPLQALRIQGTLSERPQDELTVNLDRFGLAHLQPLINNNRLLVDGTAQGAFTISDIFHNPTLISDLTIANFTLNEELIGDVKIRTDWNNTSNQIDVLSEIDYKGNDTTVKVLSLKGSYLPVSDDDNFNFEIRTDNLKIKPIGQFIEGVLSEVGGYASGELKLKGKRSHPQLTGMVAVRRGQFRIDFLQTKYTFSDKIYFEPDRIAFKQMVLSDTIGNKATANGSIHHRFFKDFVLDLELLPENLLGINTTARDNSFFYGTARATGRVHITGPTDRLDFDIQASTEKGTAMYLPISYTADVSENSFIEFINKNDTTVVRKDTRIASPGLNLNMEVQVTDNASIYIFLPMQMGNIKVNGEGLMKINMPPSGEIGLNGTYVMNEGSFYFNLRNLFSRTFRIKPGSTISWAGDVYEADINLQAVYQVRPSLSTLPSTSLTDSSYMNSRIPVDCIIVLTGDLFNPTIRFRLEMPDVREEEYRTLVYNSIDTTNEAQLNQQMMSLLVLNSFSVPAGSNVASSMGLNSYELLTNQLNSWLSQISDDFNIGVNYQKGNTLTPEQVEVALSTQLFNDRVTVSGNFGVGNQGESEETSNIVGDVLVEVKISEDGRLRVRAYNKTNTYDLFNYNTPYTQGVGISYRKDFNRFRDIFKRSRKEKDATDQSQQNE